METWDMIRSDRLAFADLLDALSPEEWQTTSLCDQWTVKGVAAHLLVAPTRSKGQVFLAFASAGFNLDKMSAKLVNQMVQDLSTDQIAALTRQTAANRSTPPGLKPIGMLTETVVHGGDAARPLGRPFDVPVEHQIAVLDHLKNVGPVFKAKQRIQGLHLQATDADWQTGSGASVQGPVQSLVLAVAGRKAALDDLSGEGVEVMRSR